MRILTWVAIMLTTLPVAGILASPAGSSQGCFSNLLALASEEYSASEIDSCVSTFTAMKKELLAATPQDGPIQAKLDSLNTYFFGSNGFTYTKSLDNISQVLLPSVVKTRQGNCLGLSCLYISLGETLGLPLSGGEVPGHFFVILRDTKQHRNIDMALAGGERGNLEYCSRFGAPTNLLGKVYLRPLSSVELVASVRGSLGTAYLKKGNYRRAAGFLSKALQSHPNNPQMWSNLGIAHSGLAENQRAVECLQKAVAIDSSEPWFHLNLAQVYADLGDSQSAATSIETAITLKTSLAESPEVSSLRSRILFNSAEKDLREGKYQSAIERLEVFTRAYPKNANLGNAYNNLTIAYYMHKRYSKAQESMKAAATYGAPVDSEVANAVEAAMKVR